jgi:hypothetical protein
MWWRAGHLQRQGLYQYSKTGAKQWERAWVNFTYDVAALVRKYERRVKL